MILLNRFVTSVISASLRPSRIGVVSSFYELSHRAFRYQQPTVHKDFVRSNYYCNYKYKTIRSVRLFGSKRGSGGKDGFIYIENNQTAIRDIDIERIKATITKLRRLIGYETYDVSVYLVNDKVMKETNYETRGINKPTDILSFPFHAPSSTTIGLLEEPIFDVPDYYQLGDIIIDVPYVVRRCIEDQDELNSTTSENKNISDIEDECENRGVSGAMSTIFNPEDRINMLLVHGMLHLLGYDHETDQEYEIMVAEEEKLVAELEKELIS